MKTRELKVLLLEDNPDHAELIVTVLRAEEDKFRVDICDLLEDFMDQLNNENYDAYLIDYNAPGPQVLDVLDQLTGMDHHVPVIFISGTESKEIITRVLHAGAADFIIKSRTSLKTLPIVIKRNIIRKMSFNTRPSPYPSRMINWSQHLEESLKKITQASTKLVNNIKKGHLSLSEMEEIQKLERLMEKTQDMLKNAKKNLLPRLPSLKKEAPKKAPVSSLKSNSDNLPE